MCFLAFIFQYIAATRTIYRIQMSYVHIQCTELKCILSAIRISVCCSHFSDFIRVNFFMQIPFFDVCLSGTFLHSFKRY